MSFVLWSAAITMLNYLHMHCHLISRVILNSTDEVFSTVHFLHFLSFPDQTLVKLLYFLQAPELSLLPRLSKHQKNKTHPLVSFSWELAGHRQTFLQIPRIISPCLTSLSFKDSASFHLPILYPIKKRKPSSVWFWDNYRSLRSDCSPYCNSLAF